MKQYILLLVLMVMGAGIHAYAEDVNPVKEGNVISGHVVEKGTENSLPYATILIVETGQGTVSNEDGEFRFKKVPAGKYTLRVQLLGYETQEKKVTVSNDFTVDVHFLMSDESIMTDEVVVSANRNETSRKVAPVVVNVMNAKLFFHKGMNTGKTSTPFFPFDKVIRKEIPVHITGFYNLDNHFFLIIGCRQLHTRPQQQGADTYSIFHFSTLFLF